MPSSSLIHHCCRAKLARGLASERQAGKKHACAASLQKRSLPVRSHAGCRRKHLPLTRTPPPPPRAQGQELCPCQTCLHMARAGAATQQVLRFPSSAPKKVAQGLLAAYYLQSHPAKKSPGPRRAQREDQGRSRACLRKSRGATQEVPGKTFSQPQTYTRPAHASLLGGPNC